MIVTSQGAVRSPLAASIPPNPPPTITTRGSIAVPRARAKGSLKRIPRGAPRALFHPQGRFAFAVKLEPHCDAVAAFRVIRELLRDVALPLDGLIKLSPGLYERAWEAPLGNMRRGERCLSLATLRKRIKPTSAARSVLIWWHRHSCLCKTSHRRECLCQPS